MASRAGPLSALAQEDRSNVAGGAATAGLYLAMVEHDLFAAWDRGTAASDAFPFAFAEPQAVG